MSDSPVHVSRDIMNSFMSHVIQYSGNDGCWIWKGSIHKGGGHNTPSFSYTENQTQKNQPARAFIHQRTTGEFPKSGTVAYRSKCGNPLCVKPSHISITPMKEVMTEVRNKLAAEPKKKTAIASVASKTKTPNVVKTTIPAVVNKAPEKAKEVVQEYKNKNPLQFLAEPIKDAIAKQKIKINITQSLVSDLEKELSLFENELKRIEG